MSIRPIAFDAATKVYTMIHDESLNSHTFEMNISEIEYSVNISGDIDWSTVIIPCKLDNSVSIHPVGGGAAPLDVQTMFVEITKTKGCPCGTVMAGEPDEVTLAHEKMHCSQQDFVERWQVPANSGDTTDILVNDMSSYVVGIGPFTAPISGYSTLDLKEALVEGSLDIVLQNTYTKIEANKIVAAGRPTP